MIIGPKRGWDKIDVVGEGLSNAAKKLKKVFDFPKEKKPNNLYDDRFGNLGAQEEYLKMKRHDASV